MWPGRIEPVGSCCPSRPRGQVITCGASTARRPGGWLVYANYQGGVSGQCVQFFHYDPDDKGWYVYGLGTVATNGTQVVPDPSTRLYEFTGAMINSGNSPAADGNTPAGPTVSDPV